MANYDKSGFRLKMAELETKLILWVPINISTT